MNDPLKNENAGTNIVAKTLRARKFWRRTIWISLAAVIVGPLYGLAGTTVGMIRAFRTLDKTGTGDPESLAGDIGLSMQTTAWGLVFSAVAFLILLVALVRFLTLPKPDPFVAKR